MPQISIAHDVCKKDGLCALACTRAVFRQEEKNTIPTIVDPDFCFNCGHCVAICPHGAISHSDYPEGAVSPVAPKDSPTYDQVMELIHSRRSMRLFKDKTVEKEVIKKVLEAARFAPSGHNEQSTEFVVIQDKQTIQEIGRLTANGLLNLVAPLKNPIGRFMMRRAMGQRSFEYVAEFAPELEGLVSMFNDGTDWILHEPPVLFLACADSVGGTFAGVNANLAVHNAALAAETLGLGCFYTGFIVIAGERDDSIEKFISLPETHKIYGGLAMGYPKLKYKKWPKRNPARVSWIGFD